MTFRKPHRICNIAADSLIDPVAAKCEVITTTLKELKDKYELRISIPGFKKHDYKMYVTGGVLYVCKENERVLKDDCSLSGHFLLPANIWQDEIKAFYRNYGLKVIMPIIPPDGKIINIPII